MSEHLSAGLHMKAYQKAVSDKDVAAFMQLYDEKVCVFDAWGTWSYEGAAAWQKMVESWFSALGTDAVRVSFDEVKVLAEGMLTTLTAIAIYTHRHGDGAEQSMHNRISWVLKGYAGSTKVLHEHTSVPVRYEDSKAILQRSPAS